MKLAELFQTIESLEFSVRYGVTNSLSVLRLVWQEDETIQALIQTLHENTQQEESVIERLKALIATEFEAKTWHPQDMAASAYLYILEQLGNLESLEQGTKLVLSTKGFYWANKLAQKIVSEKLQNLPQKP
jgi:hypothetical protein